VVVVVVVAQVVAKLLCPVPLADIHTAFSLYSLEIFCAFALAEAVVEDVVSDTVSTAV
jgi:hypothetical protein